MSSFTRKGDDSRFTYLEFLFSEKGISICVHPGKGKHDSLLYESVRFCTANAGGRSNHTYKALTTIEKKIGIYEGLSIFEGVGGSRVVFMRGRGDSDFWLKTNNPLSSGSDQLYGAEVLFLKGSENYALAALLLNAVQKDNAEVNNEVRPVS